jgi:hypothetical protein
MQSERRAVRAGDLADAKTRRGAADFFYELKFPRSGSRQRAGKCGGLPTAATRRGIFKKRNGLVCDADNENKARWNDAVFFAGKKKLDKQFFNFDAPEECLWLHQTEESCSSIDRIIGGAKAFCRRQVIPYSESQISGGLQMNPNVAVPSDVDISGYGLANIQ